MTNVTGKELIAWGFEPGPWFSDALIVANRIREYNGSDDDVIDTLRELEEKNKKLEMEEYPRNYPVFLDTENDDERENKAAVLKAMDELMRLPTVKSGAVMPDACPAGTIPVGAVVETENTIHPGLHSADVCCSMAISVFKRNVDTKDILDAAMKITHFGPGKRKKSFVRQNKDLKRVIDLFGENQFLDGLQDYGEAHFMTQGDGNHFFFVGKLESTGQTCIVTHHGSRGVGARLYKRGMLAAQRETKRIAKVPKNMSWLDMNTEIGKDYWDALQIVREWTRLNHYAIHDAVARKLGVRVVDRYWNEHNFVFKRGNKYFHAKGSTPVYEGFERSLIPMNMAEPILVVSPSSRNATGFAPHGAGRNMSRTKYLKGLQVSPQELMESVQKKIDLRFYTGKEDLSELPGAYKSADTVIDHIVRYNLCNIDDVIQPLGTIMAGEINWSK